MTEDRTKTIKVIFETREAADLAVEHLVQQQGISRPDIFIQSAAAENTAGVRASGGDVSHDTGSRDDGALEGEIEVSVDVAASQFTKVQRTLGDAGALRVSGS